MSEEEKESYKPNKMGRKIETNAKQLQKIVAGTLAGLPAKEIAEMSNTSLTTVRAQQVNLQPLLDMAKHSSVYRANIGHILQGMILERLVFLQQSPNWDKATIGEQTAALERIHKMMRLESGQSTSNISALLKTGNAIDDID